MQPLQWNNVTPNFSGSGQSMAAAGENFKEVGNVSQDFLRQMRQDKLDQEAAAERKYQHGREKVSDDRATIEWDQKQAEIEKLKNASLLSSRIKDTAAANSPKWDQMYKEASNPASGVNVNNMQPSDVVAWYNKQHPLLSNIDISGGTVNTGSVGSASSGPLLSTKVAGTVTSPVAAKNPILKPVPQVASTFDLKPATMIVNNQGKLIPQTGKVEYTDIPGSTDNSNTTRPSMSLVIPSKLLPQSGAQTKVDKVLTPTTPVQQKQSVKTIDSAFQKMSSSTSNGTSPKMTQVEAGTIDKIFANIDPNKMDRQQATSDMSSMLFSLGLNPSQVKEYTTMAVDSVYGDKNDPVSLAIANAKVNAYGKNVDSKNDFAEKMYHEQMESGRHNSDMAQRMQMHRESLAASKVNSKEDPEITSQRMMDSKARERKVNGAYNRAMSIIKDKGDKSEEAQQAWATYEALNNRLMFDPTELDLTKPRK